MKSATGSQLTGHKSRRQKRAMLAFELLENRQQMASDFEMVVDINSSGSGSDPHMFTPFGSSMFFLANDARELWRTDGNFTSRILQSEREISDLTVVGTTLFFSTGNHAQGLELYKSDGSVAGTVLVKEINVGASGSFPRYLTNLNGTLYFAASDGTTGTELWKSDGTIAGTLLVADINAGAASSYPTHLANFNGTLVFSAQTLSAGRELWRSNGTAASTNLVADINTGTFSSSPREMTTVGSLLYFSATGNAVGTELWKYDGAIVSLVRDIATAGSSFPQQLTNMNGELFFAANNGSAGVELWKSNGTLPSTTLVQDIYTGTDSATPTYLVNANGTLYFAATSAAGGRELWKSTGAVGNATQVLDIVPGISDSSPRNLRSAVGVVTFEVTDSVGSSLWKSDGTAIGTTLVFRGQGVGQSQVLGSLIFFGGSDLEHGFEPWVTDTTVTGTRLLLDINTETRASNPSPLVQVGEKFYFTAVHPAYGAELWVTDGTTGGTHLVKDIVQGASGSFISIMTNCNGLLYFLATDATHGLELWRSDGTAVGTYMVKDIRPGPGDSGIEEIVNVNGSVYFNAFDGTDLELWKSDGSAIGTTMVTDINVGGSSNPQELTNVQGTLFFRASTAASGRELWRSDGSVLGTSMVKDISIGSFGSFPNDLTNVNGRLFFSANSTQGPELWSSDGTASGTIQIKDINPGGTGSFPSDFTLVNSTLFFLASDGLTGRELWKTDGTNSGTVQVRDILDGPYDSFIDNLTNVNGILYFSAKPDVFDRSELWRSNGTQSGTTMVQHIRTGSGLANANGYLIFQTSDALGAATWTIDPFGSGTMPLVIGTESPVNSLFRQYLVGSGTLFGIADEVYRIDPIFNLDYRFSSTEHHLLVRTMGNALSVIDSTTSNQVASISPAARPYIRSFTIEGSHLNKDSVVVDYTNGFFSFPDGMHLSGGVGSMGVQDLLQITGAPSSSLTYRSEDEQLRSTLKIRQLSDRATLVADGYETIMPTGFQSIAIDELLVAGPPQLDFSSQGPLNLGEWTWVRGGSLNSTGLIALGSGEMLTGFGAVNGRFAGDIGSVIQADGNLVIGQSSSRAGFATRGDLHTLANTVTLIDADEAVLGSLTTLGQGTAPGSLNANQGLLLDFGGSILGTGTINSPNLATKPFMLNGDVVGDSPTNNITLTGFIKGVGSLSNVTIAGTYSPGFSPAAVTVGSLRYAAQAITTIELGGVSPGVGHDQINHVGGATLGGTLDVRLINSYQPAVGAVFEIMTATAGFSGDFNSQLLPPAPLGAGWNLSKTTNSLRLQLVDLAEVASTQFGDGTVQRSRVDKLVVTFQGAVDVDAGAFNVWRRGVGGGVVTSNFSLSVDGNGNTVATLSFSGVFTRAGGALVDGFYQLTIDNSRVRRAGTQLALDGNGDGLTGGDFVRGTAATDKFFAFFGDTNGDGVVGVAEFGEFRNTFGRMPGDPGYNLLMDFDGAGVGVADFGQFRSRFGRAIGFE